MGARQQVDQLAHPAFLYAAEDEFLDVMVPYVNEGVDRGEVVFVATKRGNVDALERTLGGPAKGIQLRDTDEWYPHPANRLRAFSEFVEGAIRAGARAIRLAGEPVWPEGPPEFVREWQRYESVLNTVLAPYPVSLVCLYDSAGLGAEVLGSAELNHRSVRRRETEASSPAYEPPELLLLRLNPALSRIPVDAKTMRAWADLAACRRFVGAEARDAGLVADRIDDLCLAADEVFTNGLLHGGGVTDVSVWTEDRRFLCQIDDHGPGVADPLAGYHPPTAEATDGFGLWLARQLVDLLQVVPATHRGTSVRLHVYR